MTARFEPGDRVQWADDDEHPHRRVTATYVGPGPLPSFPDIVRVDEPAPYREVSVLDGELEPVPATSPHAGGYARVTAGRHTGLRGWLQTSEGGALLVVTDDGKQHMPEDVDFIRPCAPPPDAVAPDLVDVGRTVEVPLDLVMVILERLGDMRSRTLEERLRACLTPDDNQAETVQQVARRIRDANAGVFDRLADL